MSQHLTLILGGARSGKTKRALSLAETSPSPIYVATAEAHDDEMRQRIAEHQVERETHWRTIEAPLDLANALNEIGKEADASIVVVDCLTLWLSNLMLAERDVAAESDQLLQAVQACVAPIVLVSNEVGFGLVPDTALGRNFRDAQGRLNQRVAEAADTVELVVSGLPMRLKP